MINVNSSHNVSTHVRLWIEQFRCYAQRVVGALGKLRTGTWFGRLWSQRLWRIAPTRIREYLACRIETVTVPRFVDIFVQHRPHGQDAARVLDALAHGVDHRLRDLGIAETIRAEMQDVALVRKGMSTISNNRQRATIAKNRRERPPPYLRMRPSFGNEALPLSVGDRLPRIDDAVSLGFACGAAR